MKYAVIKSGGKQYRVSEKDEILVDSLKLQVGDPVVFKEVLLSVYEDKVSIGQPYVEKASVSAKVQALVKGEKVRTAKYKAKSRYDKVVGYRHSYTKLLIEKI